MDNKKLFQIGEVAKMFGVSVGTLRHYEQAGLLTPEYVDPETGYRYFSIRQFEVLNTIRYLRVLDMPLTQIREYLENRDIQVIQEKLRQQKEEVDRRRRQLEIIEQKISHRMEHIEDAIHSQLDQIVEKEYPDRRIVWVEESLSPKNYLDLEFSIRELEQDQTESLVFLGKVGVGISKERLDRGDFQDYDRVFILLDQEDYYKETRRNTQILPGGTCVTIRFRGSHTEAPVYYEKLLTYLKERSWQIAGFSREITLIDNGITSDPEKFVTEIQIPVVKVGNLM